ncbi:hypothetical protein PLANPX_4425 [Lacipirellula parvula]|uniref:Uncharacterized protein n=1 Tax=Lacipirellula parvula TaxID=2650471 RepID=A0A5K7XKJ5_9BACT|nr:hypothetical protein PLANPX_4425 [Lacipirellula parvula]
MCNCLPSSYIEYSKIRQNSGLDGTARGQSIFRCICTVEQLEYGELSMPDWGGRRDLCLISQGG